MTMALGAATPTGTGVVVPTGQQANTAIGSLTPAVALTLPSQSASTAVGSPTVVAIQNQTIVPSGLPMTSTVGSPQVNTSSTVLPGSLFAPISVGSPQVFLNADVIPTGVAMTVGRGNPAVYAYQEVDDSVTTTWTEVDDSVTMDWKDAA